MAKQADPNGAPSPQNEFEYVDDTLEDTLYARHVEIKTFEDLEGQRGTSIPALFNLLYKFVQNPSSVSVETYKRMVDTDDTVGSGVDFLSTALAARLGRYTHPSAEISEFVNKALDEIDGGWVSKLKELYSASWAGFSVQEKVWANKSHGFVPEKLITLPPSTVLFETERTGELTPDGILQYQRNYNPYLASGGMGGYTGSGWAGGGVSGSSGGRPDPFAKLGDLPFPVRTANSFNYLSIRIPRQKCIHYAFNAQGQFGNPYGRSLLRRVYKYYVTKDAILQMMMIALDRKGTPLTIVFADPNTMVENPAVSGNAESFRNNAKAGITAAAAAAHAFRNVHNDSVIILPGKKGEIYDTETLDQSANTGDFIQALDFANKGIMRGLLVPALIFTGGDGSGSYSLGQEHAQTFDKICDSINAGIENTVLQQLVKEIIAYNFPRSAWENDGLGGFSKRKLSRDEIQKEMEVFEKGIDKGIIDQGDLNDLNKMRDTIGFEPRETPIEKPMFGGMGGLPADAAQGTDEAVPGAEADKTDPKKEEESAEKAQPKKAEEQEKTEAKKSLMAALKRFFRL